MKKRTYTGEADLKLLQDFNAVAIDATDHCGYLHPGDIPHHIYNGNKHYDPVELMTIWEDDQGVAAWLLANPSFKCFDAQVRPDLRGGDFERAVLEEVYDLTAGMMRRHNIDSDWVYADAFQGDPARAELLTALGWEPDNEDPYVLNRTEIGAIDLPTLPEGFSFRSARALKIPPPWRMSTMPPSTSPIGPPSYTGKSWNLQVMIPSGNWSSRLRMAPS